MAIPLTGCFLMAMRSASPEPVHTEWFRLLVRIFQRSLLKSGTTSSVDMINNTTTIKYVNIFSIDKKSDFGINMV
ncbi:hypothetical protein PQM29_000449 [Morganella morganii]|nr:hypothetical protein [Morganella morganii]